MGLAAVQFDDTWLCLPQDRNRLGTSVIFKMLRWRPALRAHRAATDVPVAEPGDRMPAVGTCIDFASILACARWFQLDRRVLRL